MHLCLAGILQDASICLGLGQSNYCSHNTAKHTCIRAYALTEMRFTERINTTAFEMGVTSSEQNTA